MKIVVKLFCLFLLGVQTTDAQQLPFHDEIQDFKKQDSVSPPPQNAILFVGSSSFNLWKDVHDYFPKHIIINRGFGGSSLPDVIRYANNIIFPYHPKQIVIYCGENDLASSDTITSQIVFARFVQLFQIIRYRLPEASIVYVSLKPSPSRAHLMAKMTEANQMLEAFLSRQKNAAFVNVYPLMLTSKGKPIPDIFKEDSLHMNAKGYAIWQKAIEPYLVK